MENNNKNKNRIEEKQKKGRFSYSLLTIVLIVCIIELSVSAMNNINKNINFSSKIKGLEDKKNEEYIKNVQLKSEIENFDSEMTLESIARNNLKMAEKDEVLIIINRPKSKTNENINVNNKK